MAGFKTIIYNMKSIFEKKLHYYLIEIRTRYLFVVYTLRNNVLLVSVEVWIVCSRHINSKVEDVTDKSCDKIPVSLPAPDI